VAKTEEINGIKCVIGRIKIKSSKEMRPLGDQMRDKLKDGISVLIADVDNKASILVTVSANLTSKYQAGKIVNQVAVIVGGKGGGRPDMAQAGGKDVTKIDQALQKAREIIAAI